MLGFTLRTLALRRGRRMGPAKLAVLQRARLATLVGRAIRSSAFYREKFRGIDPARFSLADLPTTNKSELMADFDRVVTDPSIRRAEVARFMDDPGNSGRLYLGRYVVSHTSGSQGQPLLIVQDRSLMDLSFGLQMTRGNAAKVTLRETLKRLVEPVRLAAVTLKGGFYPSATMFRNLPAPARRFIDLLWLSQTDADLVDRLNAFRPTTLTAYAGVLEILALEAEAGRLRIGPWLTQVVSNSEALTDRARARIEAAFGHHVMNNYATGECTFLSNGCPTDEGSHVNADWAILEVVDDDYRPVPDGTPGQRVLITNLANFAQPIIRYEVGDVVTMATEPCGCGSRLPRVARIAGRTTDVFWVGEGGRRRRLINMVLGHAMEYLLEVREWQAIQTAPCRITIRLEPLPGETPDLAQARSVFARELPLHGFDDLEVDFEVVPRLDADPSTGKFKRMISRVDGPAGPVPEAEDVFKPASARPRIAAGLTA